MTDRTPPVVGLPKSKSLAEMRALALALIALEQLPAYKRPHELMDTFRQMLAERRLLQRASALSYILAEAKKILRPDLSPDAIDREYAIDDLLDSLGAPDSA
jgi:hypothetical protein